MEDSKVDKSLLNDSVSKDKTKPGLSAKEKMALFLESTNVTIFISIVTLLALFGDDIRILVVDVDGDKYFYGATVVCLVIFSIEIFLSCLAKKDYLFTFFFWLDLVSTASLLFDIGWFTDLIFPTDSTGAATSESAAQLAKAARASRIGTRAARVIRIIRLIRLIRIVKLYKASQKDDDDEEKVKKQARKKVAAGERRASAVPIPGNTSAVSPKQPKDKSGVNGQKINSVTDLEEIERDKKAKEKEQKEMEEILKETEVGKKLTSKITKIVISLILLIMLSGPVFTISTWFDAVDYSPEESAVQSLGYLLNDPSSDLFKNSFNAIFEDFNQDSSEPIMAYIFVGKNLANGDVEIIMDKGDNSTLTGLRDNEIKTESFSELIDGSEYTIVASFNARKTAVLGAWLGMGRTIFVCVVLATSSVMLSTNCETLVIEPIEQMLKKVNRISENPLEAAKLEIEDALKFEEIMKLDKKERMVKLEQANYEPSVLEKVIMKIGALLAIGFGEAGSGIIAENMRRSGTVDPMLPGVKCYAVFGFCDIRYFAEVTEILKADIMIFVNSVAEIVHGIVDQRLGASNKNIGDAFLLVWKVPKSEVYTMMDDQMMARKSLKTEILADMSILAFIEIIAEIQKNKKLAAYSENEDLKRGMGGAYKINMGFGLHIGWAIEGAIGSSYKIDASYLSPNVNMAARLEAATKQFGVTFLISGPLQKYASIGFKQIMRKVDKVTVKELYTVDLDYKKLKIDYNEEGDKAKLTPLEKRKLKLKAKNARQKIKWNLESKKTTTYNLLHKNDDIRQMRESYKQEFFETWKKGMENYLNGKWDIAWEIFKETKTMLPGVIDGPSKTLISVIERNNGEAPEDWKGFRPLTSK